MQFLKTVTSLLCMGICMQCLYAQNGYPAITTFNNLLFDNYLLVKTDSGVMLYHYYRAACKNYSFTTVFISNYKQVHSTVKAIIFLKPTKPAFIQIHGNIAYDFIYRSGLDSLINRQNLQQHSERVNLDVLIKEKYPLKLSFTTRQSNSPYFRDFMDMNLNFDRYAFNKNLKQELIKCLSDRITNHPGLKIADDELKQKIRSYNELNNFLSSGATLQKIIEEKEKQYQQAKSTNDIASGKATWVSLQHNSSLTKAEKNCRTTTSFQREMKALQQDGENKHAYKFGVFNHLKKRMDKPSNIKADSLLDTTKKIGMPDKGYAGLVDQQQSELIKLKDTINQLQRKADSVKNVSQQQIAQVIQQINKATSLKEIKDIAIKNGIPQEQKGKFEDILTSIKTLGIGRSILNYTELTAQNITITGINVALNPSWYSAFAAGKIDYRFRDFYNRNSQKNNNQYLVMGRLGIGDIDKKALIFSFFQGRKGTSQYGFSDSVTSSVNIMGYSLEAIFKKDEFTGFSAEMAKSTLPVTGNLASDKQTGMLFKFSDPSNMGINLKAQTSLQETNTRLSGFYRRTGKNFQSFSLFSYNTDQTAWLIRGDQPFLNNKINLTGMLRQNDFTNPFTDKTYKTSTIFKSVLVSIRFPKYPSLSVGYYPGTQLYFIDKEKIRENAYYILNGSLVYSYFYNRIRMNSSIIYNRYFNKATDSGFVLNKGINYYALQTIFLKKMQLKAGYAFTSQQEISFYTFESAADYSIKSILKLGAGLKYNQVISGKVYIGQQVLINLNYKQLGGLTIQYEKSFLPTFSNTLIPIEMGRISWFKTF